MVALAVGGSGVMPPVPRQAAALGQRFWTVGWSLQQHPMLPVLLLPCPCQFHPQLMSKARAWFHMFPLVCRDE